MIYNTDNNSNVAIEGQDTQISIVLGTKIVPERFTSISKIADFSAGPYDYNSITELK
mgnify:CR=1 FL=1